MRLAAPEDVPLLLELMAEFYAESGFLLNRDRAQGAFSALLSDARLGHVWVIESDSRDVGYVAVTYVFSLEFGGLMGWLEDFFIQSSFRAAGIGTDALRQVRAYCVEHGIRALSVEVGSDNVIAQSVYRRIGMLETGRRLMTVRLADPTHDL